MISGDLGERLATVVRLSQELQNSLVAYSLAESSSSAWMGIPG